MFLIRKKLLVGVNFDFRKYATSRPQNKKIKKLGLGHNYPLYSF